MAADFSPLARSEAWERKAAAMEGLHLHGDPAQGSLIDLAQETALDEVREALVQARLMLAAAAVMIERDSDGVAGQAFRDAVPDHAAVIALADVLLRRVDFVVARSPLPSREQPTSVGLG